MAKFYYGLLMLLFCCNWTLLTGKVTRRLALHGIGVVASSEKDRHHFEDLIRKSIFNEIDTNNAAHVHISDQVEPLIKKMVKTNYKSQISRDSKDKKHRQNNNGTTTSTEVLPSSPKRIPPTTVDLSKNKNGSVKKVNVVPNIKVLFPEDHATVDDEDGYESSGDKSSGSSGSSGEKENISGSGDEGSGNNVVVVRPKPKQIFPIPTRRVKTSKRIDNIPTLDWYSVFKWTTTSTTTMKPTTTIRTTTNNRAGYTQTRTHLFYYGPCMFCKPAVTYFEQYQEEMRRKQFRSILMNYDFVFLAHKFPSGLFGNVLSFEVGQIKFPAHSYLQIHAPLSCGCFAEAENTRYIVAGSHFAGRMILNSFYPLYKVNEFKDIEEIQEILKFGKRLLDTI